LAYDRAPQLRARAAEAELMANSISWELSESLRSGSLLAGIGGPDLGDQDVDHNRNREDGNLRVGRPGGFSYS
jgi:hypothetical protein